MSLHPIRLAVRELRARSRNYKHAAILRRHIRARYGAVAPAHPSILIGEALATLSQVPWTRVAVLLMLVVLAARS